MAKCTVFGKIKNGRKIYGYLLESSVLSFITNGEYKCHIFSIYTIVDKQTLISLISQKLVTGASVDKQNNTVRISNETHDFSVEDAYKYALERNKKSLSFVSDSNIHFTTNINKLIRYDTLGTEKAQKEEVKESVDILRNFYGF